MGCTGVCAEAHMKILEMHNELRSLIANIQELTLKKANEIFLLSHRWPSKKLVPDT